MLVVLRSVELDVLHDSKTSFFLFKCGIKACTLVWSHGREGGGFQFAKRSAHRFSPLRTSHPDGRGQGAEQVKSVYGFVWQAPCAACRSQLRLVCSAGLLYYVGALRQQVHYFGELRVRNGGMLRRIPGREPGKDVADKHRVADGFARGRPFLVT